MEIYILRSIIKLENILFQTLKRMFMTTEIHGVNNRACAIMWSTADTTPNIPIIKVMNYKRYNSQARAQTHIYYLLQLNIILYCRGPFETIQIIGD